MTISGISGQGTHAINYEFYLMPMKMKRMRFFVPKEIELYFPQKNLPRHDFVRLMNFWKAVYHHVDI